VIKLVALATAFLASSSTPALPAGEVAYSRLTHDYWQVWVYRVETHTHRQVTRSPSDKHAPAWTRDGEIVFQVNGDSLFRVAADGSAEKPFLRSAWPAIDPAFDPRGKRVVLSHLRTDISDVSALWLVAGNQQQPRALTRGPGLQVHPSWSPDAAWVAFEHSRGTEGSDLSRVSVDGAKNEIVLAGESGVRNQKPAYAPDGSGLAYSSNRSGDYEIWSLTPPVTGGTTTRLTQSAGIDSAPAWSPDSRAIAFTSRRRGKLEVWTMRADGSEQRPLFEVDSPAGEPAWR
jgi:Tol biopolymer transport system component